MSIPFIHLHLHSEYSILDGTIRIPALIKKCLALNMPAVAITDQMNLFSLVKFYRAAERSGIKPIIGSDLLVVNADDEVHRLTVLCQNRQGYLGLCQLLSRAYIEGQIAGVAHVRREWLQGSTAGLIALSGPEGEIGQALLNNHPNKATSLLAWAMRVFPDRFYLELVRTGRDNETRIDSQLIALAAEHGCPLVASNDVRFLEPDEFKAHEARVCIHEGRLLSDKRRARRYSEAQYFKDSESMCAVFDDVPESLANSVEIARRCNLEMPFGAYHLPDFPMPQGEEVETYLRKKSGEGLEARFRQRAMAEGFERSDYDLRLERELEVINSMGFGGYFLIVADFIRWARNNGIPVGPGRGSGAGSLVAYALGITDLDPLEFDLLFERFLNPERVSMPDFDIDFCMENRDRVIEYVADRYGHEQVSQIITFGTMAARAVVRDSGRVLGHGYGFVDSIAKLIPMTLGITLEKALEEEPVLQRRHEEEEDTRAIIDLAKSLEGLTRNAGKHAGGVVIAPSALTDFTPLFCEPGGSSAVTQFDKDDVESIGLVKFDFLGLRTLTIINWALQTVNQERRNKGEPEIDLDSIPLNDPPTFNLLQSTRTKAVFQLESRGMRDLIRRLVPDSFNEIVALVALFRPGPLESGMVGDYIDRKHGRATVRYPHPKLEPILKPTYGVILYQEQVMQIAQDLAGYSLGAADILRRAMGKKKPAEMAKQRQVFVSGAEERGVQHKLANVIFDQMETFAGYGFNKSHSAAYALIAYHTAWLKAHYPAAFMAAVLSSDMDNTDKVDDLIRECRAMEIEILPPDVNDSDYAFGVRGESSIRYGLGAIKGVGRAAIDVITADRESSGPYSDLYELCNRVDGKKVNRRVIEALIRSGSMDAMGQGSHRAQLMSQLDQALQAAEQAQHNRETGQSDMFGSPAVETIESERPEAMEIRPWTKLQCLRAERETLGLFLSGHPVELQARDIASFTSCVIGRIGALVPLEQPGSQRSRRRGVPMVIGGMVRSMRRRNAGGAFVSIEDETGRIEVALFNESWALYSDLMIRDDIVIVEGQVSHDDFTGGYRMNAQKVMTLSEAKSRFACGISIALKGPEEGICEVLEATFAPYRGGSHPVYIDYRNTRARARMELGENHRVNACDELVAALGELACVSGVQLLYERPSTLTI